MAPGRCALDLFPFPPLLILDFPLLLFLGLEDEGSILMKKGASGCLALTICLSCSFDENQESSPSVGLVGISRENPQQKMERKLQTNAMGGMVGSEVQ